MEENYNRKSFLMQKKREEVKIFLRAAQKSMTKEIQELFLLSLGVVNFPNIFPHWSSLDPPGEVCVRLSVDEFR